VDIVVGDVVEEDRAAWLRSPTLASGGQKDNNGVRATLLPFHHCHGGGAPIEAPIEGSIEAPMNHTGPTALPLGQPTTWSFDRDVWPNTPTVRLPPTTPRVRLTRLSIEENGKTKRRNVEGVGAMQYLTLHLSLSLLSLPCHGLLYQSYQPYQPYQLY
jgi:hypothetical protein